MRGRSISAQSLKIRSASSTRRFREVRRSRSVPGTRLSGLIAGLQFRQWEANQSFEHDRAVWAQAFRNWLCRSLSTDDCP